MRGERVSVSPFGGKSALSGLLRRFAPRNDEVACPRNDGVACHCERAAHCRAKQSRGETFSPRRGAGAGGVAGVGNPRRGGSVRRANPFGTCRGLRGWSEGETSPS
ncbi:MAG: hypothetical protein LBT00_07555 [Spirochaetaceae bacterium]|nr:hypothetical protein [Spirochaetaceae bacterium]